jgi:hypothetical protein
LVTGAGLLLLHVSLTPSEPIAEKGA